MAAIGAKAIDGYSIRYIKLLKPNLTRNYNILPYSSISEMGASMYKGVKKVAKQIVLCIIMILYYYKKAMEKEKTWEEMQKDYKERYKQNKKTKEQKEKQTNQQGQTYIQGIGWVSQ